VHHLGPQLAGEVLHRLAVFFRRQVLGVDHERRFRRVRAQPLEFGEGGLGALAALGAEEAELRRADGVAAGEAAQRRGDVAGPDRPAEQDQVVPGRVVGGRIGGARPVSASNRLRT
jgi:hypothetical protein